MAEYIDREAMLNADCDCSYVMVNRECYIRVADVAKCLSSLPAADVVEVCRCKNCKHSFEDNFDGSLWCCRDDEREVVETHFCSYGERRTE